MFKTLRNLWLVLNLIRRIEPLEDGFKLGRIKIQTNTQDIKVTIDGVFRLNADYLLFLCDDDVDPYNQQTFLQNYADISKRRCCGANQDASREASNVGR